LVISLTANTIPGSTGPSAARCYRYRMSSARSPATPLLPAAPPGLTVRERLAAIVSRRAVHDCTAPTGAAIRFYRFTQPRRCRKLHAFGPALSLVVQGNKTVELEGQRLSYDARRYLVVTAESAYDADIDAGTTPARPLLEVSIDIPVDLVVKTLLALADGEPGGPAPVETAPAYLAELSEPVAECVLRLLGTLDDPQAERLLAPLVLEELVFHLLRSDAARVLRRAAQGRDAPAIHRSMRFMRAHSRLPLTVAEVARTVGMSASHFAHRFRAVARQSPMRYLKQLRLHAARDLLLAGDVRVATAADQVGYQSTSHFTRDFKLLFGVSPAEYARRFRR
jgi:AraC-like DNA-binding protein